MARNCSKNLHEQYPGSFLVALGLQVAHQPSAEGTKKIKAKFDNVILILKSAVLVCLFLHLNV